MTSDLVIDGVFVIGITILIISGYGFYWLATGNFGASYAVSEVTPVEQASNSGAIIEYTQLPPEARASFDAAHEENSIHQVWESEDPEAVQSIIDHRYVRKDGQLFEYGVVHGDNFGPGIFGFLPILFGIGGVVLIGYGIDKRYGVSLPN